MPEKYKQFSFYLQDMLMVGYGMKKQDVGKTNVFKQINSTKV